MFRNAKISQSQAALKTQPQRRDVSYTELLKEFIPENSNFEHEMRNSILAAYRSEKHEQQAKSVKSSEKQFRISTR